MKFYSDIVYLPEAPEMCRLDIWAPEHARAAYLYLHGGGITHGDKCTERTRPMFESLASEGIAVFSANYRFLPVTDHDSAPRRTPVDSKENDVDYPVFIEDCAAAFRFMMTEGRKYCSFDRAYIGGSSAGGYITMMLCFDRRFLASEGYDSFRDVAGYIPDAGQPTTHFHMLELRGESDLRVMVDETAPFWYLDHRYEGKNGEPEPADLPRLLFFTAENDMPGRVEQNALFVKTLINFGYPAEKIMSRQMTGYGHCKYLADPEYIRTVAEFLKG